jgi:hypothetical protein
VTPRCHLVYALAPAGVRAREANDVDPGPLEGWNLSVHPLTFSLSAVGFSAQTSFTLEQCRGISFEELAGAETDDPRYWWKRAS